MIAIWEDKNLKFVPGKVEANLWAIKAEDGVLLVYVDDLLICGSSSLIEYVAKLIAGTWETTNLEVASQTEPVSILGCEIYDLHPFFSIDQAPYIRELLRGHGVASTQMNVVPCPRDWLGLEDCEEPTVCEEDLRQAHRLTGELLWITQEVALTWRIMKTKHPKRVVRSGQRMLGFLQRTIGLCLELRPSGERLTAFSDALFAPSGSRSHTGSLVLLYNCPVAWRSGRQAYHVECRK